MIQKASKKKRGKCADEKPAPMTLTHVIKVITLRDFQQVLAIAHYLLKKLLIKKVQKIMSYFCHIQN